MQYLVKNDGRRYGRNRPATMIVSQQAKVLCYQLHDFPVFLLLLLHSRKTFYKNMDHRFFGNGIKLQLVYLKCTVYCKFLLLGFGWSIGIYRSRRKYVISSHWSTKIIAHNYNKCNYRAKYIFYPKVHRSMSY